MYESDEASQGGHYRYPLTSTIATQVRLVHRMFVQDLERFLEPHGVTVSMWYFLRALWDEDGLSQRDLSERVSISSAAAVEPLRSMERRRLIERRPDAKDRRRIRVFLTDEGRSLKSLLPLAAKMNNDALDCLSVGEVGFLGLVLSRLKESHAKREEERDRHGR